MAGWWQAGLSRTLSLTSRLPVALIMILLFVAPLAHEGVTPMGALAVEVLTATAVFSWIAVRLAAPVVAPLGYRALRIILFAVVALVLFQSIPLPVDLAARMSTIARDTTRLTWPLLLPGLRPGVVSLSSSPGSTLHGLLRFVLLVGLLFASRDLFRGMGPRHGLVHLMLAAGIVQVLVGVAHIVGGATTIYFIPGGPPGEPHFFGSFVSQNRNAAYLNFLLSLALAVALERLLSSRRRPASSSGHSACPALKADRTLLDAGAYGVIALVLATGVVLCASRMGWLIMAWELVTLAALFWARCGRPLHALFFWLGSHLGFGVLGIVFRDKLVALLSQLSEKPHPGLRPVIWRAAWKAAWDNPWFGSGLDTFKNTFAKYSPFRGFSTVLHADNTYLDILVELGLPGTLLVLAAIGLVCYHVASNRFWLRARGQGVILGLCAGLGGLLIHSFVEHTVRGYGTLVPATIGLGLLLAAIRAPDARHFEPALRYGKTPPRVVLALSALPVALALVASMEVGELVTERARGAYRERTLRSMVRQVRLAVQVSPWSGGPVKIMGTSELLVAHHLLVRSLDEDPPVARATLAEVPGHLRTAEVFLSAAAVRDPLDGYAQRALSRIAQLRGERHLARALAADACRVQPRDYRNRLQLARILDWIGEDEAALDAFGEALLSAPDPALDWMAEALFEAARRDPVRAGAHIPQTDDWRPYFAFGSLLAKEGSYSVAAQWLDKVIELSPDQFAPISKTGYLAMEKRDLEMAEKASRYLRERFPQFHGGYALQAHILAARGRTDEAVAAMLKAAALHPSSVEEALWAARLLARSGALDRALGLLDDMQASHPGDVRAPMARARLLWNNGRQSEACEALRVAIDIRPYLEEPRYLLWQFHRAMGGAELLVEAEKDLQACVALPYAPRCRFEAARQALENDDADRAVALLEAAVAQDDSRAESWRLLARARYTAGDRDGAIEALTRAIGLDPENSATIRLKADINP